MTKHEVIKHIKYIVGIAIIFAAYFTVFNVAKRPVELNVSVAILVSLWIWFLVRKEISAEGKEQQQEKVP